jgi:hypothetical protein
MTGEDALARVAELFKNMKKSAWRERSPETDTQETYVRSWREEVPNVTRRRPQP